MSSSVEGICTEGNSSSTSTMVGFLDHFHSSYSCKPCSQGKREGGRRELQHQPLSSQVPQPISHQAYGKAAVGGSEGRQEEPCCHGWRLSLTTVWDENALGLWLSPGPWGLGSEALPC